MTYIYFIRAASGHWKVGRSAHPERRLWDLSRSCPVALELVAVLPVSDHMIERRFHERYIAHHHQAEWFHDNALIDADVRAVLAGSFDPSALPAATEASLFRQIPRGPRSRYVHDARRRPRAQAAA